METRWSIAHVQLVCDKCGDRQRDTEGGPQQIVWSGWRQVTVARFPTVELHDRKRTYDLCPGCAGMLEHFLGLKADA